MDTNSYNPIMKRETDLMSATNQVQVVLVQELRDDLGAERERHTAVVLAPAHRVLVVI